MTRRAVEREGEAASLTLESAAYFAPPRDDCWADSSCSPPLAAVASRGVAKTIWKSYLVKNSMIIL